MQLHDAVEKQQAILSHFQGHIQNSCDGCEYSTTNQAMECTHENNEVVLLRAELFSPPNITEHVLNSLRSWIHIHSTGGSIVVQGLRLYPERDCPLIVESFGSPSNCYQTSPATSSSSTQIISTGDHPQERSPNAVTEGLAIIGLLGCGILTVIVLVLVLYVGYQRYKKNCQKSQRLR